MIGDRPMYSLDTSMFMDWQARLLPSRRLSVVGRELRQLINAGECAAVALVKEEIDSVGTPGLQAWAKGKAGLFVPLTTEIQQAGAAIEAMYPDLLDAKSPYQSADAYVIALAQIRNGVVVSQETSAAEKAQAAQGPLHS